MSRFQVNGIKGVIPALITSFDERDEFDERRMRAMVRYVLQQGIHGLYLTGSTGEGFTMTPDERKRVVDVVMDEVAGAIPIIVHIGAIGTKVSIDLARHAEKAGADAISSVPPFYWKFSEDQIFNYYRDITHSVGIPMIVYNVALAGAVGVGFIKRLAQIDGVAGVKYTLTSHYEMLSIKEEISKEFILYSGCDEMAISGLQFGADGLIGSTYNAISDIFLPLYDLFRSGDTAGAMEKQKIANAIIMALISHNFMPCLKAAINWMGVDAGFCREPFGHLSVEAEQKAKAAFCAIKKELNVKGVALFDAL